MKRIALAFVAGAFGLSVVAPVDDAAAQSRQGSATAKTTNASAKPAKSRLKRTSGRKAPRSNAATAPQAGVVATSPSFEPIYNWTGLYLGLNGGGTWGTTNWSSPSTGDFNVNGGLIGGTVGYNWQTGNLVLGAEADLAAVGAKGDSTVNCAAGCETSQSWLGTTRGRVGYAFDRFLPYVTAGGAVGDIKAGTAGIGGASTTNLGWTAGGGFEFGMSGNWTAKAEYLYVDLGDLNCGIACGGTAQNSVTLRENLLRAGVNYRF